MIVNTDNRLMANVYRRQWEPMLDGWISAAQQGFLPGRSMISNIVGVEAAAQVVSLSHSKGGILLLDFRAAFPSISQDFLLKVLKVLRLPKEIRNVVANLYSGHSCDVCFGKHCCDGFLVESGIRQGCPLSPLLFAFTIDILLRRIKRLLPGAEVFAFADDIALVVPDVESALQILSGIFDDLEKVAGLALNRSKCILIPLWPADVKHISQELITSLPRWADLKVSYSGMYLGAEIGPEGSKDFWSKATRKYIDRARTWGQAGLGLFYSSMAYAVYVLPVMSFLTQLRSPREDELKAEGRARSPEHRARSTKHNEEAEDLTRCGPNAWPIIVITW